MHIGQPLRPRATWEDADLWGPSLSTGCATTLPGPFPARKRAFPIGFAGAAPGPSHDDPPPARKRAPRKAAKP